MINRRVVRMYRFTVLELIAAGTILVVLAMVFSSSLFMIQKMRVAYDQEQRSILLLDNIVERLRYEDTITVTNLKSLVADEFEATQFPRKQQVEVVTYVSPTGVEIVVKGERWKPISSIRLDRKYVATR